MMFSNHNEHNGHNEIQIHFFAFYVVLVVPVVVNRFFKDSP